MPFSRLTRQIALLFVVGFFFFPTTARGAKPLTRSLFITAFEDPPVLASRKEIDRVIDFATHAGIQTLFVQIYRANQAWFPSQLADQTAYKENLKKVGQDSFALLIEQAHAKGIQVHAWINLLSLSTNKKAPILKKYGLEILTRNLKPKRHIEDYKIDDQYFLEPGDPRVRRELSGILEEILAAYPDLDGVQFDYIRYPDVAPAYGRTPANEERFKAETGLITISEDSQIWKDWKRAQVTELLGLLVQKARQRRPDIQVSTTGCVSYDRAYQEAFQDWPRWINVGLIDFVTLMNYPDNAPEFKRYILDAQKRIRDIDKLSISVPAYKLIRSPEIFEQQFRICEQAQARSCVVFYYGSVRQSPGIASFLSFKKKF